MLLDSRYSGSRLYRGRSEICLTAKSGDSSVNTNDNRSDLKKYGFWPDLRSMPSVGGYLLPLLEEALAQNGFEGLEGHYYLR